MNEQSTIPACGFDYDGRVDVLWFSRTRQMRALTFPQLRTPTSSANAKRFEIVLFILDNESRITRGLPSFVPPRMCLLLLPSNWPYQACLWRVSRLTCDLDLRSTDLVSRNPSRSFRDPGEKILLCQIWLRFRLGKKLDVYSFLFAD